MIAQSLTADDLKTRACLGMTRPEAMPRKQAGLHDQACPTMPIGGGGPGRRSCESPGEQSTRDPPRKGPNQNAQPLPTLITQAALAAKKT